MDYCLCLVLNTNLDVNLYAKTLHHQDFLVTRQFFGNLNSLNQKREETSEGMTRRNG